MTPLGYFLGVKKKKHIPLNEKLESLARSNGSVLKLDPTVC